MFHYIFDLHTENSHHISDKFFTENVKTLNTLSFIVSLKRPESPQNLTCFLAGNVSLYTKINHCIVKRFYRDASKVWIYYYFLFQYNISRRQEFRIHFWLKITLFNKYSRIVHRLFLQGYNKSLNALWSNVFWNWLEWEHASIFFYCWKDYSLYQE